MSEASVLWKEIRGKSLFVCFQGRWGSQVGWGPPVPALEVGSQQEERNGSTAPVVLLAPCQSLSTVLSLHPRNHLLLWSRAKVTGRGGATTELRSVWLQMKFWFLPSGWNQAMSLWSLTWGHSKHGPLWSNLLYWIEGQTRRQSSGKQ